LQEFTIKRFQLDFCDFFFRGKVKKVNSPSNDVKTRKKQAPRYTSIDLMYETFGNAAFVEAIRVVMVSTVVTPRPTRAGDAPLLSQNETHEMITMRLEGM